MPAMTNARRNAVIGIVVAAVLGSIISTLGGDGGEELGGLPTFAWLVIIAFGVNIAVFVPSFLAKTEHYYDLTGSLTYLTVTLVALATTTDRDLRTVLLAAMIVLWAARLGSFLFRRVTRDGGDGRFDKIKLDALRFSMAWMLQALWVTLTAGAALAAMTSGAKADLGPVGIIGLVVWLIGFAIEVTADRQKSASAPIRPTEAGSSTSGCGRGVATPTTSARSPSGSGSPSWRRPSCRDGSTPPSSPRSSCSCCSTS